MNKLLQQLSSICATTRAARDISVMRKKGAAMIMVILFFVIISVAIIESATVGAMVELRTYSTLATSKFSYVAAEASIEDIFYRTINGKLVSPQETLILNGASSTVVVVDVSSEQRDVYSSGNADGAVRKIFLTLTRNANASFPYGAQIGEGGIILKQNATVSGVGLTGGLYSNGQIIGANGVSITGNVVSSSGLSLDPVASSTTCTADEIVGKTNPNIDFAQSFVMSASTSMPLTKLTLHLKRDGNASPANILITADDAGKPSTTALATTTLQYSSVATSYGWVDIAFGAPATLDPGTTYWIVFDSTQNSTKYWYWCRSGTDTYSGGAPLYKQDWLTAGSWTAVSAGDMTFKITYGGGVSKIDKVAVSGIAKADAITDSTIGEDAYYQSISGSTVGGNSYPGSLTPPYIPLPVSSSTVAQWKSEAENGGTINGNCGVGGVAGCNTLPLSLGPKKIDGNFDVDGGNDPTKILTVTGTLYVTGNMIIQNKGRVQCAPAFLGASCVVIVDGYIQVKGGATLAGSGVAGSYIMMLSTKKGCLGTTTVGCTTNDSAIALENNVDGALFYATDSLIDISNNATITAVVGYMLQLQNGSRIQYDSSVAALSFSPGTSGMTGAWNSNTWNEY